MTDAPDQPVDEASAVEKKPAESTQFAFQNKVFNVPGSYFALAEATGDPTFFVPLGDMMGVMTLPQLRSGFEIKDNSPDAALLKLVEKGLSFVRRIHPGDSIPRELLDGSGSWAFDDRHRQIAEAKLLVRLVGRLVTTTSPRDRGELLKLAADPSIRQQAPGAAIALAESIGLGKDGAPVVQDRLARMIRELSYVEALRDHFAFVKMIVVKLTQLAALYEPAHSPGEEISRIIVLMKKPLGEFDAIFEQVDQRSDDLAGLLRNVEAGTTAIREVRDEIRRRLMGWDDLVRQWKPLAVAATPATEALIRTTYRFVAVRFPGGTDWLQSSPVRSRR